MSWWWAWAGIGACVVAAAVYWVYSCYWWYSRVLRGIIQEEGE